MKAVVARRYGGVEVLDLAQRPEPEVGPTAVLIAGRAASLNQLDYKIRNGDVKLVLPLRPPIALGCDVSGVVAGVGARVSRFWGGFRRWTGGGKGGAGARSLTASRRTRASSRSSRRARASPKPPPCHW